MASKSELKRQKKAVAKKQRERQQKKQRADLRKAVRESRETVAPSAPMWRRAGHWLRSLYTLPPAIANDEVLMLLAKVSLLLRGMYKQKPTSEVAVALTVIDSLGTGLSGAEIPEAWDLVSKETVQQDAEGGANDDRAQAAKRGDDTESSFGESEAPVEAIEPPLVGLHGGDGGREGGEPVLDPAETLED